MERIKRFFLSAIVYICVFFVVTMLNSWLLVHGYSKASKVLLFPAEMWGVLFLTGVLIFFLVGKDAPIGKRDVLISLAIIVCLIVVALAMDYLGFVTSLGINWGEHKERIQAFLLGLHLIPHGTEDEMAFAAEQYYWPYSNYGAASLLDVLIAYIPYAICRGVQHKHNRMRSMG